MEMEMTHKERHSAPQALELSDDELAGLSAGVDQDSITRVEGLNYENTEALEAACKGYSEAHRRGDNEGMRMCQKAMNDCRTIREAYMKVLQALKS
jgi:hypothetical protein